MKIQRKNRVLRGSALHKTVKGGGRTKDYHRTNVSSVHNAVKNIKKAFEQKRSVPKPITENAEQTRKIKAKKPWKFRTSRGIVYVGHIPHGFYEEQMQEYFKQFGDVTRVRVARSKNTGRSRGYGYVEFSHQEVAKIAAETMNNYLMCGRLLKAVYVSPEKQHTGFFAGRNWTEKEYPKLRNRELSVAQKNAKINEEAHVACTKSTRRKLVTLEKKLTERGVDLKFEPVRVIET